MCFIIEWDNLGNVWVRIFVGGGVIVGSVKGDFVCCFLDVDGGVLL